MQEQKPSSWIETFISLAWYEALLRFIANFIAKSSEILLTAGLVVSSANFLSDGSMLRDGTPFAIAWAWTQAIAIDGSLGVSFYSVFHSMKQRDWIKFFLYSILTIILTLVAWSITEGDIFSHAINTSGHNAMQMIGIDVRLLSTLRAIAVVGFVLMSRLRDVTLWETAHKKATISQIEPKEQQSEEDPLSKEEVERIIQNVLEKHFYDVTVTPEDDFEKIDSSNKPQQKVLPEKINRKGEKTDQIPQTQTSIDIEGRKLNHENIQFPTDQDTRLQIAYEELKQEGQQVSGRSLAQRAHIRRATCLEWLRKHDDKQQEERVPQLQADTEQLRFVGTSTNIISDLGEVAQ